MVKVKKDLTGMTFGRLFVLRQDEDYITLQGRHMDKWRCQCSCGNPQEISVIGNNLRKENGTRSCGCLVREQMSIRQSKENSYDLTGDFGIGWTNNTNNRFFFDLEDYDKIKGNCWHESIGPDGYHRLVAYIKEIGLYKTMAQVIAGDYFDHIDRNPLNNRKNNLRTATKAENARNKNKQKNNTSGVSGVGWHKASNMWYARITVNNKQVWLGCFADKNDAITARLQAEKEHFGEFAPQQHLFEQYKINMNGASII